MKKNVSDEMIAMHVSVVSIAVNVILSGLKLLAGIIAFSGAMISDAVHSASDVFSTIIVIIGVKLSAKKSDKEHPYGHERMECVAAIVLAMILLGTGLGIGYSGILKLIYRNPSEMKIPGLLALIAAIVSILTKEWMYWFTYIQAKRINSGALMADAWHHRSDALSSVGSFVGILGARVGFPILDPLASVIICLFIIKAAVTIFTDAINKMVDKSCDDATVKELHDLVLQQKGVIRIDELRTRAFGNKLYVDLEIAANGNDSLIEAHAIANQVHDEIEKTFPLVKHIMVHVNPDK